MKIPLLRLLLLCLFSTTLKANQVVLVTGASRGIGAATAELLAEEGYTVYAGVRHVHATFAAEEHKYHLVQLDVTDDQSVERAINEIIEREGRIDVLVNNAGIMIYGSVENVTIREAKELFDVNFFGAMRMTQAVLPHMRAQENGRIIQISSRSGFRPLPSISLYAASKFALEGLSEAMAALLKPWNIRVTLVEPGPVSTDLAFFTPYGSRLSKECDPYFSIFSQSGLLSTSYPTAQTPMEIADIVKELIENENPPLRYQTTEAIRKQAAKRFLDISGNSFVEEWQPLLFPNQ